MYLVDVGNTRIKCVEYLGQSFIDIDFSDLLNGINSSSNIILSAVSNNEAVVKIRNIASKASANLLIAETEAETAGIKCGYPEHKNLGVDRWLAVIGAVHKYPNKPLIIVDAGTAMTIDFFDGINKHLGGWIIPGLKMQQSSIVEKAPLVFSEEKVQIEQIPTNTPSALFSGCTFSLIAAIEKATVFLGNSLNITNTEEIKIVITGGDSEFLLENSSIKMALEKHLVFVGLKEFGRFKGIEIR